MVRHVSDSVLSPELDILVLTAGAGPVELVLALELSRHGIDSVRVQKRPTTTTFPKMDVTSGSALGIEPAPQVAR
jgi:2-polyprenyl-6-methoxyphenol hydroxylase-like FAD-dependent oxidoreductase